MAWGANETSSSCPRPFGRSVLNTKSGVSAKPDSEQIWAGKNVSGELEREEEQISYTDSMAYSYHVMCSKLFFIQCLITLKSIVKY